MTSETRQLGIAVLGDSMAQGLVNGAVLETRYSFPALIAEACGVDVGTGSFHAPGFVVPSFFPPGIPINLERLLRDAEFWSGPSLDERASELAFLAFLLADTLRNREQYSRLSPPGEPHPGPPDHLAISGITVRDCIELTAEECDDRIEDASMTLDGILGATAPKPLLLIAKQVLNAARVPERQTWSAVRCFREVIRHRKPSAVLIHLGNADVLGAVADLDLKEMPADFRGDRGGRRRFNVTHPQIFRHDYLELGDRIARVMHDAGSEARVFIGTLPHATVAPFIHGFGRQDDQGYFEAYGRFFVRDQPSMYASTRTLSREQVKRLDRVVDRYNDAIREVAGRHGWYVVEVGNMVSALAVRRQFCEHTPDLPLRRYVNRLLGCDPTHANIGALLDLHPVPDVRLFRANARGERAEGGLFGYDCGHPSTLGYGLVADLFLREMRRVGVAPAGADIRWKEVIERATSVVRPPRLWREVLARLEGHPAFFDLVFGSDVKLKQELVSIGRKLGLGMRRALRFHAP